LQAYLEDKLLLDFEIKWNTLHFYCFLSVAFGQEF
jgi:hypothetical protein